MKKIYLSICIFIICIFASFVYAGETTVKSIKTVADIEQNGDLFVTETLVFEIEGSGNGLYRTFTINNQNSKNSLNNPTNIEIKSVKINGKEMQYQRMSAQNGDNGIYNVITDEKGNMQIKVFTPSSNERKELTIDYIMKDVVVSYNDVAELYINFVGDQINNYISNVEIQVNLPTKSPNLLKVFAHGPLNGVCGISENKESVYATVTKLPSNEAVDVRVLFDNSLVTSTKIVNEEKLDNILADELKLSKQAENKKQLVRMLVYVDILMPVILLFYCIKKVVSEKKKMGKPAFDGDYYRELPEDYGPAVMNKVLSSYNNSGNMTGTLLNLIRKGYISVEEVNLDSKMNIFGTKKNYLLKLTKEPDDALSRNEKTFINKLIFRDEKEITTNQIKSRDKSYIAKELSYKEFLRWTDDVKDDAIEFGVLNKENKKNILSQFLLFLTILICMFSGGIEQSKNINPIGFVSMVICIFIASIFSGITKNLQALTKKGREHKKKWLAFKKFLLDFSNMQDYTVESLAIWEHYLVYAAGLGIADKVIKQLNVNFEKEFQDENFIRDYAIMNICMNQDSFNSFSNSFTEATSSAFVPPNFDGSGGGFSGGGGGGRWRRWSWRFLKK